jgi:thymidylate synthase
MVPDELIGNLGDIHLYNNHIDQATEQISREIYNLPQLVINDEFWNPDVNAFEQIEYITPDDFDVINYKCHPRIKAPLSN